MNENLLGIVSGFRIVRENNYPQIGNHKRENSMQDAYNMAAWLDKCSWLPVLLKDPSKCWKRITNKGIQTKSIL